MAAKRGSGGVRVRSAITGRYLKPGAAKTSPKTTVVERPKKK